MKILSLLNPSSWLGQILVLGFFIVSGIVIGLKIQTPCPPTTEYNIDQNIKAKKGAVVEGSIETTDFNEWLRQLDKKERKAILKNN